MQRKANYHSLINKGLGGRTSPSRDISHIGEASKICLIATKCSELADIHREGIRESTPDNIYTSVRRMRS